MLHLPPLLLFVLCQTTLGFGNYEWVKHLDPQKDVVRQLFTKLTESNECDLPVFHGKISAREFRTKYWNKSPFLIRGGANNWPGKKKWTKDYLIENFGSIRTQIGTSQGIIRNGGQGNEYIGFGDYVENVWGVKDCEDDHRWCGAQDNRSKYDEEKYLFDRQNFMEQAQTLGINMDMNFPAFFRTSEVASKTYSTNHAEEARTKYGIDLRRIQRPRGQEDGGEGGPGGGGPGGPNGGPGGQPGPGAGQGGPNGGPPPNGEGQQKAPQGNERPKELPVSTVYMFLTPKYDRLVGVGMHQHTDGWNAQVTGDGTKLWVMYPPQVRPGPEHPVRRKWCCGEDSWVRKYLAELLADKTYGPGHQKPLLCAQQTGDILYVPEWWHHATLSGPGPTGKSGIAGVASQLADPSGELRYLYQARAVLQQAQQVQQEAMRRTQQAEQNKLKGPVAPNRLPLALQEPGDPRGTELMEVARQLFRDHVQSGGITGHVSANELLTLFMGDVYKLEANGTDNSIIQNTPGFQEASELVEYRLKYDVRDGQTSAHASKLAQIRNATSEALYHIRNAVTNTQGTVPDFVIMFADIIKSALGGEDQAQATSRAIATIRAGITHPAYLKNSGVDLETYAKAMVIMLQGVMYQWTNIATMYPYDRRVLSVIKRCRNDLRWIQQKYPAAYDQMAKFMRETEQEGGGGGGGPGGQQNYNEAPDPSKMGPEERKMYEQYQQMSPEEQKSMRETMQRQMGPGGGGRGPPGQYGGGPPGGRGGPPEGRGRGGPPGQYEGGAPVSWGDDQLEASMVNGGMRGGGDVPSGWHANMGMDPAPSMYRPPSARMGNGGGRNRGGAFAPRRGSSLSAPLKMMGEGPGEEKASAQQTRDQERARRAESEEATKRQNYEGGGGTRDDGSRRMMGEMEEGFFDGGEEEEDDDFDGF